MNIIREALKGLVKEGLVEQVDGNGHYRLTAKGRILAEAFGGCDKCPHCIATRGGIDPADPALTTNQPPKRKKRP